MYGILVLCWGYLSYVWDTSLMFWENPVFGSVLGKTWDVSLKCGVLVLCMGYLSYVWGICLMYGVLVLCIGY